MLLSLNKKDSIPTQHILDLKKGHLEEDDSFRTYIDQMLQIWKPLHYLSHI